MARAPFFLLFSGFLVLALGFDKGKTPPAWNWRR
jgi:hypothetical protein